MPTVDRPSVPGYYRQSRQVSCWRRICGVCSLTQVAGLLRSFVLLTNGSVLINLLGVIPVVTDNGLCRWVNTSMQASSHGSQVWPPVLPVPKDMGEDVLYSVVECAFIQNRWSCIFLEVEDVHCLGQVWGWFGRELQEIPKYTKPVGTEKTSQINHPASGIGLATVREYTLERNLQEMVSTEAAACYFGTDLLWFSWSVLMVHIFLSR